MKALKKVRDRLGHHDSNAGAAKEDQLEKPFSLANKNNSHIDNEDEEEESKLEALKSKASSIKRAVVHPRQTLKERPQRTLANQFILTERPWLEDEQKADKKLKEAYEALRIAKEDLRQQPRNAVLVANVHEAENRISELEEKREEIEVAWHMSRYVHRARVVRQAMSVPSKDGLEYRKLDSNGQDERFLWVKWLGHVCISVLREATQSFADRLPACTVRLPEFRPELHRSYERPTLQSTRTDSCN